jgi:hypothetical protein
MAEAEEEEQVRERESGGLVVDGGELVVDGG